MAGSSFTGADAIVTQLIKTASDIKLEDILEHAIQSVDELSKLSAQTLQNIDGTMNFQNHTIGCLSVLAAKYNVLLNAVNSSVQGPHMESLIQLLQQTNLLIDKCNREHLQFAVNLVSTLVESLVDILKKLSCAKLGIYTLSQLIDKLRYHNHMLTIVDYQLCCLCLLAKNFDAAVPYLNADITEVYKVGKKNFDSKSYLLYFYYGGLIYTALKKYERALYFYEIVISAPASCVSTIMVEGYKKYLLVHLISLDTEPEKGLVFVGQQSTFSRVRKGLTTPYQELVQASRNNSVDEMNETVTRNSTAYTEDCNMGLVRQCVKALYKKNIRRLTQTFLTLSLTDVAQRVKLANDTEAEKILREMIEDSQVYATINKRDGMVYFHDSPEHYDQPNMLQQIHEQTQNSMQINNLMSSLEKDISSSPQYFKKVASSADDGMGGSKSTD